MLGEEKGDRRKLMSRLGIYPFFNLWKSLQHLASKVSHLSFMYGERGPVGNVSVSVRVCLGKEWGWWVDSSDHIWFMKNHKIKKVDFSQLSNHDPYPFNQSDSNSSKHFMAIKFSRPHPSCFHHCLISTQPKIIALLKHYSRSLHGSTVLHITLFSRQ